MNGARGYIDFIECNKEDPDDVEIIWVVFNNKESCAKYRSDFRHLRGKESLDEYSTPILPVKKRFQIKRGNIEYQRKQFALTLGYCLTAHKCQGETFDGGVIIDFRDGFVINGSFYVAITRVKTGSKLFLKDFDSSYIKVTKGIEDKIEHMRKNKPYIFLKKYLEDKIFEFDKEDLKICYLNINNLTNCCHSEYVNGDKNLLNSYILCLSDTRLTKATRSEDIKASMPNWDIVYRHDCEDGTEHMGMLFLAPLNNEHSQKTLKLIKFLGAENIKGKNKNKNEKVQVEAVHFKYCDETISFLYARTKPSISECKQIHDMTYKSDFVLGDLNLCCTEESDEQKLQIICGKDKIRHLNQITTVRGNQPDHILVTKDRRFTVHTDAYFNFVSDHKGIILRMSHYVNDRVLETKPDYVEKNVSAPKDLKQNKTSSDLNLEPLSGNNWLNDIIINEYNSLLMNKFTDIFIYPSYFSQSLFTLNRDYENLKRYTRSKDIFAFRIIMFPLIELSHWFLAVYEVENNYFYMLDPYTRDQPTEHTINEHMMRLEKIETCYLQKHYENQKQKEWAETSRSVKIPPAIPEQMDGHNCGIFLLEFAR